MKKYQIQGNRPSSGYRKPLTEGSEGAKSFKLEGSSAFDVKKLIANEDDERYRYLLKHGIVKRVEDEDIILGEFLIIAMKVKFGELFWL